MKDWIKEASNKNYWTELIDCFIDPTKPPPPRLPEWNSRRYSRRNRTPPPSQPPPPPRQQRRNRVPWRQRTEQTNDSERQYDPDKIGRCMWDSFRIFSLGIGASETEIKVQYRALSRIYHPDTHKPGQTGKTSEEATTFFQLINNAYSYLRDLL
jgi:hypothetical protein